MPVSAQFRDYVAELLNPFGQVTFKRFFGGIGLYHKDKLFGFVMRDRIYLKTDTETRAEFEAEGAEPFTFKNAKGETLTIAYYELPARLHDDEDELGRWIRKAHGIATATRAKRPAKGKLPDDLPLRPARTKKR